MASLNKVFHLIRSQPWISNTLLHKSLNRSTVFSPFSRTVTTSSILFEETPIKMPALSPTMSTGTIVKWHKKEGDKINPGDILCEVQTDKAIVAYEFDDEGVLAKILVDENSKEISVGELIAVVCGEDDDWKNVKIPQITSESSNNQTESQQETTKSEQSTPAFSGNIKISPSARNLMQHYNIDNKNVKPTGPRGALLKGDVLKFISQNNLKPKDETVSSSPAASDSSTIKSKIENVVQGAPYIDIEISSMRRTIAKRLTESKSSTPHSYMSINCFMDDVIRMRKELKSQSISISVNDIIVKAVALGLKQVPSMNSQWDNASSSAQMLNDVDISIAVATPTGLITPIIRRANQLSLEEINSVSRDLISRAKDGKLQPTEFIGGSFSISNLGMYDIDYFTGVINPPQAAILAVGSTKQIFVGDADNYQLRSRMAVSISYDARVVDEETTALFLEKVQSNLENPIILLNSDGTLNRRLASMI